MSSLNDPPQQNPILSAYERFLENTPFVTRSILSIQVFSYLASWFVNPHYALAMIPQFVIYKYEIYRLVLSPLVNTSLFNLLFAFLAFIQIGKRLENSVGSTEFAWLCAIIGMLTNTLYFLLLVTLYMITQEADLLLRSAAGVWTILFGVIAIESVIAPRESRRRLFFFDVPVLYYPLALYALFAFLGGFGGFHLLISAGIGYAYGFGYLDVMKLSSSRARHWEESYCAVLTRRRGWVQGHAAIGGGAWSETETMGMVGVNGSRRSHQRRWLFHLAHTAFSCCQFSAPKQV